MRLCDIHAPEDVRGLSRQELETLAGDIRDEIIKTVARRGGHLASNLGVVELTLALHIAFDCPKDKLIFDVGHQCYAHKLLTGRYDRFHTLRAFGGISGFPSREESVFDAYNTGHASTAISAALGLARARDLQGENHHVVAVVGDGALTGGLCYEALNDAGSSGTRMIVVLNDNEMSISRNVGAVAKYLTHMRVSKGWLEIKRVIASALLHTPKVGKGLHRSFQRFKNYIRNSFIRDKLFSSLGFHYFGPVDGNDTLSLARLFARVQTIDEPVLVHVVTRKGSGYELAENDPSALHGTPPFHVQSGKPRSGASHESFGAAAGKALLALAEKDARVAGVTAAMTDATGLAPLRERFPDRLFDVGIAEEHALVLAAGLAVGGMRPFAAIYDTFLQRAYDQLTEDVCLQNLPVCLLVDRAQLSEDGATHHGVFGLSYMRHIPNLTLLTPCATGELPAMLAWALAAGKPVVIRYPRAVAPALEEISWEGAFAPGKWRVLRPGNDCAILAVSTMAAVALSAAVTLDARGIQARVVAVSSVKPLDEAMLHELSETETPIFTLEENALAGGFGSAVSEYFVKEKLPPPAALLGIDDRFLPHGDHASLLKAAGLDAQSVARRVRQRLTEGIE